MDTRNYVKSAVKTESKNFKEIGLRMATVQNQRLLHAGIGLTTESGELLDTLKKHIFYGKPLDKVNLEEEIGDIFWYCALIADELGVHFDEIMSKNIAKLKSRYGEKFTETAAQSRNLKTEREILEKSTPSNQT